MARAQRPEVRRRRWRLRRAVRRLGAEAVPPARCWPPRPTASAPSSPSPAGAVHDTIGIDLVAMVVDDLVVCGAEPLFMTDYIAAGKVVPERVAAIVSGIAEGCRRAGCALMGGETAEHPGLLAPDEYDVAGAAPASWRPTACSARTGSRRRRAGRDGRQRPALQRLLAGPARAAHDRRLGLRPDVAELGRTLGEELLEPTRIYALRRPRPDARRRRPRACARHRRRARREPGAGAAARAARRLDRATWPRRRSSP